MGRTSKLRSGWGATIIVWTVIVAWFLYLFVIDAPRPAWLVYLAGIVAMLAVATFVRRAHVSPGTERHKPHMLALGILFPPVDRILREAERRDQIIASNRAITERMRQTLDVHGFDTLIPPAVTARYVETKRFDVEELTVIACATAFADELPDADRQVFFGRPTDDIADVLAFLHWDLFDEHTPATTAHWLDRREAVVELLAAVVVRRLGDGASTVDEGQLATFLRSRNFYRYEDACSYVAGIPTDVADRMADILTSYAPVTERTDQCAWPNVDREDMTVALQAPNGTNAQVTSAARHCAAQLPDGSRSPELFEFLYLRRFDRQRTKAMWRSRTPELVRELAEVLSCGPQLPRRADSYRLVSADVDCLTQIIDAQDDYSLAHVQRAVVEVARHHDRSTQLIEFLDPRAAVTVDPVDLLDRVAAATGFGLPPRTDEIASLQRAGVVIEVLCWVAEHMVGRAYPDMTAQDLARASLTAVGEFSSRTSNCPDGVTRASAMAAAHADVAPVLLAVLVARHYADELPAPIVLIGDAANHHGSLDPRRVRRVEDQLAVGFWPTSLPAEEDPTPTPSGHSGSVASLESIATGVDGLFAEIEQIPDRSAARLGPAIAGAGIRPNEFDRLYLVTFDSEHGPLGALLDALSSSSDPLRARLREMVEPDPADWPPDTPGPGCLDGVMSRADDDFYTFGHYTRYARLGLLPPGITFDSFATTFFDDVRCLLRLTNGRRDFRRPSDAGVVEWEGVEVNLLSLGRPVRYDLYRAGEPGLRERSSLEADELQRRVGDVVLRPVTSRRSPVLH